MNNEDKERLKNVLSDYYDFVGTEPYNQINSLNHCLIGLCGEVGEMMGEIRKSYNERFVKEEFELEVGDILWFATRIHWLVFGDDIDLWLEVINPDETISFINEEISTELKLSSLDEIVQNFIATIGLFVFNEISDLTQSKFNVEPEEEFHRKSIKDSLSHIFSACLTMVQSLNIGLSTAEESFCRVLRANMRKLKARHER